MKKRWYVGLGIIVILAAFVLVFNNREEITSNSSQSNPIDGQTIGNQGIINCGASNTMSYFESISIDDFDEQSKKVWRCMTDALDRCKPATAVFSNFQHKIIGRNNGGCILSGPIFDPANSESPIEIGTCHVSELNIKSSYKSSDQIYPGQNHAKAYMVFNSIVSSGGEFSQGDGTTKRVECN